MNSPYMGKFQVTQTQHSQHDGLDLVGLDSKEIHSTVNGTVVYAGWENVNNRSQGFGQYVCVKGADNLYYYYGHMSQINVKTGQTVKCTDIIGFEGNTGYSFGSHCHYCCRKQFSVGNAVNISSISGIPNALGIYDDGYRANKPETTNAQPDIKGLQTILNNGGAGLVADGIAGEKTLAAVKKYSIEPNDTGNLIKWVQQRLNQLGFNCGVADGVAGTKTMNAVYAWQESNGLGIGNLYGSDWDVLLRG